MLLRKRVLLVSIPFQQPLDGTRRQDTAVVRIGIFGGGAAADVGRLLASASPGLATAAAAPAGLGSALALLRHGRRGSIAATTAAVGPLV